MELQGAVKIYQFEHAPLGLKTLEWNLEAPQCIHQGVFPGLQLFKKLKNYASTFLWNWLLTFFEEVHS